MRNLAAATCPRCHLPLSLSPSLIATYGNPLFDSRLKQIHRHRSLPQHFIIECPVARTIRSTMSPPPSLPSLPPLPRLPRLPR